MKIKNFSLCFINFALYPWWLRLHMNRTFLYSKNKVPYFHFYESILYRCQLSISKFCNINLFLLFINHTSGLYDQRDNQIVTKTSPWSSIHKLMLRSGELSDGHVGLACCVILLITSEYFTLQTLSTKIYYSNHEHWTMRMRARVDIYVKRKLCNTSYLHNIQEMKHPRS